METPVLRPYQISLLSEIRETRRRAGHRRILVTLPTGGGKSVTACSIVDSQLALGAKVIVVGHRKELIDQFYVQLGRWGIVPGIMRGQDERTDHTKPVQVGTIQTLARRDLPEAHIVLVDEAHRAPGDSYVRLLQAYPKATVFGLTATPCRLDGKPLKEHFDALVEGASYSELIESGAIVAPIVYAPRHPPKLSGVRTVAGDYHEGDLEVAMMAPHVIGDVVRTWLDKAERRKTVVFAVGIAHSRELCDRFRDEGVKAAHLDGTTPEDEREQILIDLELGKLEVVCNVGVLCEGWDQPSVKCCIMARPTKSLTLWMQCAGRILRPWGDRPPVILDHSGNVDVHGLPHEDREWSLDGVAKRKSVTKYRTCPKCYGYVTGNPCSLCGAVLAPSKPRTVKTQDGVLERIDAKISAERAADPKRAFFDHQVNEARRKGFKPGYAAAKYKEKFEGKWPPWAWSQDVQAEYARDGDWQARVEKRTREREYWQERNAQADAAREPYGYEEPEERGAFDDLLA